MRIDDIALCLQRHPALAIANERQATRAAVALILRQQPQGPEVLFIQRARRIGDPWSGDFGFPGGKIEALDGTPRAAAERETLEELGLDLRDGRYLGQLDDLHGAHLPVVVSCFVYALDALPPLVASPEVTRFFWFPLADLRDPRRQLQATVRFGEEHLVRPAIRLLEGSEIVLWGITYRLIDNFLAIVAPASGAATDIAAPG